VVVVDHASGGGQVLTQQQAMAALVGGQQRGDSYYISVDARGATDVAAVEKAGERGALRAIEELLRRQDVRQIRRS